MRNFRKYDIYQNSLNLVDKVYDLADAFPKNEMYGLVSQISRASVSIPSNIAEGASRTSEKEFLRFLEISIGSAFEVETLVEISFKRKYITEDQYNDLLIDLAAIQKQISFFISKLRKANNK